MTKLRKQTNIGFVLFVLSTALSDMLNFKLVALTSLKNVHVTVTKSKRNEQIKK